MSNESSVIKGWAYVEDDHTLDLIFPSGRVYRYYDVPLLVWDELQAAESKGTFFNQYIKGQFESEHVYNLREVK